MLQHLTQQISLQLMRRVPPLSVNSYLQRPFSTSLMSNDRKLPTFFKVTSIAPSIMRKLRDEELKKLQWKTKRNKLGEKVNDIALDDREKMEIFNARFLKQLTLSILTSDSLAAKLSGKGLNFTKAMVNAKFQKMYVFWVSTKSELTQELSEILESNAEEVRKSMEANANIGRIPKIVFIKDKNYASRLLLQSHFKNLESFKAETKLVSVDGGASLQSSQEEEYQIERLSHVCSLPKMSNCLGFHRDIAMEQINSAISKSKASHRISRKPGLNEVNQFVGYMDNNYKTGEKSRKAVVKAFINKKKKQEKLKNRQLREEECSAETER